MELKFIQALFVSLILNSFILITTVDGQYVPTIESIQEEYWQWRLKDSPEYSTFLGYYEYNDLLRSYSVQNFMQKKDRVQQFLDDINTIKETSLPPSERVNYLILKDTFQTYINGYEFALYGALNPINNLEGIHIYYSAAMAATRTRGDFENYIVRLNNIPNQINEIINSFKEAIRLNRTYNFVSINKVKDDINELLVEPSDSTFFVGINYTLSVIDNIDETDKIDLRMRTLSATNRTITAYRTLRSFIIDEYMPRTRVGLGLSTMADGRRYYQACLRWHLSYDMSPEEVHQIGLQEVERIHTEMVKLVRRLGFTGTVKEFFDVLKNDSRFYHTNTSVILEIYKDIVYNKITPKLPDYFENIPDVPLQIKEMTYDGPGGGYSSASETRPGVFWINLIRPSESPRFDYMALSLHEASPGHHLQHSYAMKATLPEYRQHTEISFYDVPFWFPFYSAYSEGWALYSEYLGVEMGLYADDYEMLGRYSGEILRACRLVVDTGLHHYGWDRQKAVEYMMNYTAYSRGATEIEVDRYVTWPGQACAYKLGEIKIKELRKKAETRLGSKFDIKKFHSTILVNGAVPMSILDTFVNEWIEETLKMADITSESSVIGPSLFSFSLILLGLLLSKCPLF